MVITESKSLSAVEFSESHSLIARIWVVKAEVPSCNCPVWPNHRSSDCDGLDDTLEDAFTRAVAGVASYRAMKWPNLAS